MTRYYIEHPTMWLAWTKSGWIAPLEAERDGVLTLFTNVEAAQRVADTLATPNCSIVEIARA